MHTIKYKKCIAQQDNKTLKVYVSKPNCSTICYEYSERLFEKELRTVVNRYLNEVSENGKNL